MKILKLKLLLLLLPLILFDELHGQVSLVKDINSGAANSNVTIKVELNGFLIFSADNGTMGYELWKSDGTTSGTQLIADINPGVASSYPQNFIVYNNILYFSANNGTNGAELWRSDGTAAGTYMLLDIAAGAGNSMPYYFTEVNNILVFVAYTSSYGTELWKTDGSVAGTTLLKDIYTGVFPAFDPITDITNFVKSGNAIYFGADNTLGRELWKTDGTTVGTILVKDIYSGSMGSSAFPIISVAGILYFSARDAATGMELWRSDGTSSGTYLVKDIYSGTNNGFFNGTIVEINGILFFGANTSANGTELWSSDGTSAGTIMVKDIYPGVQSSFLNYQKLGVVNSKLVLSANDGVNGSELWISDGTTIGTVLLKDIFPGASSSNSNDFYTFGSKVYFSSNDGSNGIELWSSDGTNVNTQMVSNINAGSASSSPNLFVNMGGVLFMTAVGPEGSELRKLDVALPISIVDFYISNSSSKPIINFVSNATTSATYSIERSIDGINFNEIFVCSRKLDGNLIQTFMYEDTSIVMHGIYYYRIKQMDEDGMISYSEIKTINFDDSRERKVIIYPNPCQTTVKIIAQSINDNDIALLDCNGKIVNYILFPNPYSILDVSYLKSGIYFMKIDGVIYKLLKE